MEVREAWGAGYIIARWHQTEFSDILENINRVNRKRRDKPLIFRLESFKVMSSSKVRSSFLQEFLLGWRPQVLLGFS